MTAAKAGLDKNKLDLAFPRVQEIPFSSETKRMTTLHQTPEGITAYAKGAPEMILSGCEWILTPKGREPLDEEKRQQRALRCS